MTPYFGTYNKATFFRIYFSRYFYPFYKKATAYSMTFSSANNTFKYGYFYSDPYYLSRNLSSGFFKVGANITPYNKFVFQSFFNYFNGVNNFIYDLYWFNYKNKSDLFINFFILFMRLKFQFNFSFKFTKLFCFATSFKQLIKLYGYFFSNR